jgi:hypothetical protein
MIQKAMSRLVRPRRNRRPTVPASRAKIPAATTRASGSGVPSHTAAAARRTQPMNSRITPTRGWYLKRMSAYAAADPSSSASVELPTATTIVFTYGRSVSLRRSTKM